MGLFLELFQPDFRTDIDGCIEFYDDTTTNLYSSGYIKGIDIFFNFTGLYRFQRSS